MGGDGVMVVLSGDRLTCSVERGAAISG